MKSKIGINGLIIFFSSYFALNISAQTLQQKLHWRYGKDVCVGSWQYRVPAECNTQTIFNKCRNAPT